MGLWPGKRLRPSAITYDRAGGVFALSDPERSDFAAALDGAACCTCRASRPRWGPGGVALAQAAVAAADAAGVPICFDGNYRAMLWEAWDSDPRAILTGLVQSASVMIGNHRDIALLLAGPFSGDGAERRREAAGRLCRVPAPAMDRLDRAPHRRAGPPPPGRAGWRDFAHQTAEVDVTGIVDRIGTGDAFAAGVLHPWLEGRDVAAMAQAGLAYAALKHSQPGDMCTIGKSELEAFSASGGVRR
jgi:2-dehydro-3-deoxygluconokinase